MSEQDIGHGVSVELLRDASGAVEALALWHPCCGGERSGAWLPVHPVHSRGWAVAVESPITVSPSILCMTCGHHGWIRDGRWVPA
jgi:hypothetical protein